MYVGGTHKCAESYDQFVMLLTFVCVCAVIRHNEQSACFVITLCIYTSKVLSSPYKEKATRSNTRVDRI
jgi:hypothetical protein